MVPLKVETMSKTNIARFENAAAMGDVQAQFYLSVIYEDGRGVKVDPVKAANWCMKAAEAGDKLSQFRLAKMLEYGRGFEKPNRRAAWHWLKQSASQGHVLAQYELGLRHLFGLAGVRKSFTLAKRYLSAAASSKHHEAAYYLGFMHMNGLGCVQDEGEAFQYFRHASALGSIKAKCSLAFLHEHGKGCQKDPLKAWMLYEQAASGGHLGAQFGLACLAISLKQYKDALVWLEIAANNGVTAAQSVLAEFYMNGIQVHRDFETSLMWCMVVQNTDDADEDSLERASACYQLLLDRATQKDIDRAYTRASEWQARRNELPLHSDLD